MACLVPLAIFLNEDIDKTAGSQTVATSADAGILILAQIVVSWWIWSVWTWRFLLKTPFRGGKAQSLLGEFQEYGYNKMTFKAVGAVKLTCASLVGPIGIVTGNRYIVMLGAGGLTILMAVAIISLSVLILLGGVDGCVEVAPSNESSGNVLIQSLAWLASQVGRCCAGIGLAIVIFGMWYNTYSSGAYDMVDQVQDIP